MNINAINGLNFSVVRLVRNQKNNNLGNNSISFSGVDSFEANKTKDIKKELNEKIEKVVSGMEILHIDRFTEKEKAEISKLNETNSDIVAPLLRARKLSASYFDVDELTGEVLRTLPMYKASQIKEITKLWQEDKKYIEAIVKKENNDGTSRFNFEDVKTLSTIPKKYRKIAIQLMNMDIEGSRREFFGDESKMMQVLQENDNKGTFVFEEQPIEIARKFTSESIKQLAPIAFRYPLETSNLINRTIDFEGKKFSRFHTQDLIQLIPYYKENKEAMDKLIDAYYENDYGKVPRFNTAEIIDFMKLVQKNPDKFDELLNCKIDDSYGFERILTNYEIWLGLNK